VTVGKGKTKMTKKIILALLVFFTGFTLGACSNETTEYDVYVTVYPMQYVTEEIMASTGLTVGIVPGVTSHSDSVDWSPKEIIAMTKASYLFYVGANYDQYIDLQIESIFKDQSVVLVKLEDETDYIKLISGAYYSRDEEDYGFSEDESGMLGLDPHFWISPNMMLKASALIYDKLIAAYPGYAETMAGNYALLVERLQSLSDSFQDVIENQTIPILTSTNIYGYLRKDYDLEYIPISPGYHEETEQFTTQEKEDIVNEAVRYDVRYIFYEKNITSPLSNAVYTALAERYGESPTKFEFDILQSLTDADRDSGKDYISVMYENLAMIIQGTDYQANAGQEY